MAKRIWRNDMPMTQREKIAQANTGKHLSDETRRKISDALVQYWAGLPFKPATASTSGTTTGTTATPPPTNPYADD